MPSNRPHRRTQKSASRFETLETRKLLAAFGTPWPEARDLTISFPADGTRIGSETNTIDSLIEDIATEQEFHELTLRAFQTWAIHADINVGLRNDDNSPLGVPGFLQGDPRFGDFRIGALPQLGLVASSLPFQATAGSYSGDILLNSNRPFTYHGWDSNEAPAVGQPPTDSSDFFSVLLHEVGNSLGLDDNLLEWSVMFRQYIGPKGVLTVDDIAAIEALYGTRTDPYELIDNGELLTATLVPEPIDSAYPRVTTRGSVALADDTDVYRISLPQSQENATVRLLASTVSLLKAKIEVVDDEGNILQHGESTSVFDNDIEIALNDLGGRSSFFVRVSALDREDIFAVGDYFLDIDLREPSVQATDLSPMAYRDGLGELGINFNLVDTEQRQNDTRPLASTPDPVTISSGNRFQWQSSISNRDDVDYLKITSPNSISGRLVIHIGGVGLDASELQIRVVDENGQNVGAAGRLRADGSWAFEVLQPEADEDYYVRISLDASSEVNDGNYIVIAAFFAPAAQMNEFTTGSIDSTIDRFIEWKAGKTRLYRFDMAASSETAGHSISMTIYDAHTLSPAMSFVARSGTTRTAMVWLTEGDYIIRFSTVSADNQTVPSITYTVTCDGISDDQDEDGQDPADDPTYNPYYYNPPSNYTYDDPNYEYPYTSNPYYYFVDPYYYYYYYYYYYTYYYTYEYR